MSDPGTGVFDAGHFTTAPHRDTSGCVASAEARGESQEPDISWTRLLAHEGPWDPLVAAALSMWAGSSILSVFGLIHPLKWLPLVLFEIAYKSIWLIIVAYPLWSTNQLAGSPAEAMTQQFLPVIFPILVMPWGYVLRTYLSPRRIPRKAM